MDGDGDGDDDSSSSGDVSSTADDEGPRSDPELPQPNASLPPTDLSSVNDIAQMRLYNRNMLLHRAQSESGPNMEAAADVFAFVFGPRDDGDGGDHPLHGDADADEYGSLFILGAVPASGVAIACLPETTVGEGETRESGECAVCLEDEEYEASDALRTMPCAHGFHERCIFGWLRVSRLCPLCRFALPPET